MKIVFIRPSMDGKKSFDAMEPMVFAILKSLTPKEYICKLYDERIEDINFNETADLIAITSDTFHAKRAYEISDEFRKRKISVVIGGIHPTLLPEEAKQYTDAVVIGEAEGIWQNLLNDLKSEKLKNFYKSADNQSIQNICPDRSIFDYKKYIPLHLIQYGRGCPHDCEFCSVKRLYGTKSRYRKIESIADEIKKLKRKRIFFTDDNLLREPTKLEELIKTLTPLKCQWACQVSLDIYQKPHLLKAMRKSGCFAVVIGLESLERKNLLQMGKKVGLDVKDYSLAIKTIRKEGLMIYGMFVGGYDFDTKETIHAIEKFSIKNHLFIAALNSIIPFPGTDLYERLKIEGRLIYSSWWLDNNYSYGKTLFTPKNMSIEELETFCFNTKRKIYSWYSIIKRLMDIYANMRNIDNIFLFLLSNILSRKEIMRKQGQKLGEKHFLKKFKDN